MDITLTERIGHAAIHYARRAHPAKIQTRFVYAYHHAIGVARILSGGALVLTKKVDDLFLVVALKERLNTPPNLTSPAKTVLKIDSCSAGGALRFLGGALTHFPSKLRLKIFSTALGVQVHSLHPLATPMFRL